MIRTLRQIFRTGIVTELTPRTNDPKITIGEIKLEDSVKKRFQRSLTVREVDAGSCNGCELEIHAINNPVYNCERFGIHFTASPRFADVLLVTGPVTANMEIALRRTYDAVPSPKLVIVVGDCGCNGGIFGESYASLGGVDKVIPVDIYIPGCPPTPIDILNGFYKIFL
ncbi:MAG: NADH-quinone oxidoreductase subunit B family protein [Nitrospirae bacterium]|nr:NADH-quinone oxidoreductase subunit B family protein [Nitrospirota bacterium]